MRAASGGVSGEGGLRAVVDIYIAALLLVEPGRAASDGLEASAGHHHVCECDCMCICHSRCTKFGMDMAIILAGPRVVRERMHTSAHDVHMYTLAYITLLLLAST